MNLGTTPALGRTIQLFLVNGDPNGLVMASIHGWTGAVTVASQSTFGQLLIRPEVERTGIYILFGPDPDDPLSRRAYIGEADNVRKRIDQSAKERSFWETAVVVTTSDEALSKGHVRYLEARLIEMANEANRVKLDNGQAPPADRRRLPEADRANMEAFLSNIKMILPIVGLDLLKPRPTAALSATVERMPAESAGVRFEVRHKSKVKAIAVEEDGEFVVLEGSEALKDTDYAYNAYAPLKLELIKTGVLKENERGDRYVFTRSYAFRSPSAAGSTVLDRNTNGRTRWHVVGSDLTYHEWQEQKLPSSVASS